jgi:hypothetical protein
VPQHITPPADSQLLSPARVPMSSARFPSGSSSAQTNVAGAAAAVAVWYIAVACAMQATVMLAPQDKRTSRTQHTANFPRKTCVYIDVDIDSTCHATFFLRACTGWPRAPPHSHDENMILDFGFATGACAAAAAAPPPASAAAAACLCSSSSTSTVVFTLRVARAEENLSFLLPSSAWGCR